MRGAGLLFLAALLGIGACNAERALRQPESLLQVGEDEDGSGDADAASGEGGDGSGSGSGAAAALAAANKAAAHLKTAQKTGEELVKKMQLTHSQDVLNNRELARQIKVLADTLNPPKKNNTAPAERESDGAKCRHDSCAACVADAECGWCITKKQCVEGDKRHPYSAVCLDWTYDACPFGCDNYASCDECLADETCSWCQDDCSCGRKGFGSCDRLFVDANAMCPPAATCPNTAAPPVIPIVTKLNELKSLAAMAQAARDRKATPAQAKAAGLAGQGSSGAPAAGAPAAGAGSGAPAPAPAPAAGAGSAAAPAL